MDHFVSLLLELIWISFISSSSAGEVSLEKHPTNITAEPGQNIILPCRAPHSKPVIAVEWSRTDLGSEYVLLYRNEQFNLENQHPSFKNRVDLQEEQIMVGDVSLVLKNVSTDDRGTYECRVIQIVTTSRRETVLYINLDVVPPPGEPDDGSKRGSDRQRVGLLPVAAIIAAIVLFSLTCKSHKIKSNSRAAAEPDPSIPLDSSPKF